jgi:hypothetical protein
MVDCGSHPLIIPYQLPIPGLQMVDCGSHPLIPGLQMVDCELMWSFIVSQVSELKKCNNYIY